MFRFAKNSAAALALAGLVLSQPVMAAGPYDTGAKVTGHVSRAGTPVGTSQDLAGFPVYGWAIAALVFIAVAVIIADDHNEAKSPASP